MNSRYRYCVNIRFQFNDFEKFSNALKYLTVESQRRQVVPMDYGIGGPGWEMELTSEDAEVLNRANTTP